MTISQDSFQRMMTERIGFVSLSEVTPSVPGYRDALDLQQALTAFDDRLELGFIFDPQSRRKDRWGVQRTYPDGSLKLERIIQSKEREYRPPDARVLLDLQQNDLRGRGGRQWIEEALTQGEREDAEIAKKKAEEKDEIRERVQKHVRDIRFKGKQGQVNF